MLRKNQDYQAHLEIQFTQIQSEHSLTILLYTQKVAQKRFALDR